ncbi:hypothetical protein [Actinomadura macrotermitis]|uniref:Lipoprotein n=1 Tax=Actinomadura macrotermitis TaxID=2585200 RepID=A0A7K0BRV2_9ACTN|nr:hypothetical protein [Actinomadura macrotermitis]MQY03867.1 hypothetical protein [Actinomadura macrotermitis]
MFPTSAFPVRKAALAVVECSANVPVRNLPDQPKVGPVRLSGAFVVCGMSIALSALLAGCGGDSGKEKKASSGATPPSAAPSSSPPAADGRPLSGKGVTLTLPAGWKQVDPTTETSEPVQTSFYLTGDMGSVVKQLMQQQKSIGVVYAIDSSVTSGFAPHLQTGCDRGGITGASMEQLKRKQKAMEPNAQITDLTVSGKPAFKATYSSTKTSGPVDGALIRVPVPGDRFCFVEIEAKQGSMPPAADQILSSFKLS